MAHAEAQTSSGMFFTGRVIPVRLAVMFGAAPANTSLTWRGNKGHYFRVSEGCPSRLTAQPELRGTSDT